MEVFVEFFVGFFGVYMKRLNRIFGNCLMFCLVKVNKIIFLKFYNQILRLNQNLSSILKLNVNKNQKCPLNCAKSSILTV